MNAVVLFSFVKLLGREADSSLLSSIEIRNEWSFTSIQYAVKANKGRDYTLNN